MCLSASAYSVKRLDQHCLNPCYVGCASRLVSGTDKEIQQYSLNPCYVGCASRLGDFLSY